MTALERLNTAIKNDQFAKMPITEELVRWNKYKGDILDRSRALGSAALQSINRYGARIFIGGFTSTVKMLLCKNLL